MGKQRIAFEVTADDIAAGERNNCVLCPVALATFRAAGVRILVYDTHAYSAVPGAEGTTYRVPTRTQRFIRRFDAGRHVEPFRGVLQARP